MLREINRCCFVCRIPTKLMDITRIKSWQQLKFLNNKRKYLKRHVSFKANIRNKNTGACNALICFKHKTVLLKGHKGHLTLYSLNVLNRHENDFIQLLNMCMVLTVLQTYSDTVWPLVLQPWSFIGRSKSMHCQAQIRWSVAQIKPDTPDRSSMQK